MKKVTVTYRTDRMEKTTVQNGVMDTDPNVQGLIFQGDTVVGSDGYHTFDELYEHRYVLFIALCRIAVRWAKAEDVGPAYERGVWRSKRHSDGTMFEDMFIMGLGKKDLEQITYHLPMRMWDATDFAETLEFAPLFDGHTPDDVIKRIIKL